MEQEETNLGGRPTAYKEDYARQAQKICELGGIDDDLADFFQVSIRTIYYWKANHPEFLQSLKVAKEPADDRVKRSLFHRATGMRIPAMKVFMPAGAKEPVVYEYDEFIPPDVKACMSWLGNRCGWKINPNGNTDGDEEIPEAVEIEEIDASSGEPD